MQVAELWQGRFVDNISPWALIASIFTGNPDAFFFHSEFPKVTPKWVPFSGPKKVTPQNRTLHFGAMLAVAWISGLASAKSVCPLCTNKCCSSIRIPTHIPPGSPVRHGVVSQSGSEQGARKTFKQN